MKKGKKLILAIALVALVGLVGGAYAYFSSTASVENVFKTATYSTKVSEEFTSPDNWVPGTTTTKKVYAENTGSVDVAVRISYTESWTSASGDTLSLTQDGNTVAIINFANSSDWTKCDDYYYYNGTLAKGEKTSSFIESVTFNADTEVEVTCSTENNVTTCESTTDSYAGATYKLVITVETIQADAKDTAWGTCGVE